MQKASKLSGTALMIITASSKIYLRRFFVMRVMTLLSTHACEISTTRYAGARCLLYKKITFPL